MTTSSNGEASCASCHIFGDMDDLAWDLGNPDDAVKTNPIPINLAIAVTAGAVVLPAPINGTGNVNDFHPMKGPMTTQTLRGLVGSGAMHWRGDRSNPPGTAASAFDETCRSTTSTSPSPGWSAATAQLTAAEMQKFTDFALQMQLPPNPVRALDNTLNAAQAAGAGVLLRPAARPTAPPGRLRPAARLHLRGLPPPPAGARPLRHRRARELRERGADHQDPAPAQPLPEGRHVRRARRRRRAAAQPAAPGPQIRGFGFLHDGSVDTLFRFFNATVFNDQLRLAHRGFQNDTQQRNVEQFMLAFDTNLAPIVGQQITLTDTNGGVADPRIDVLVARAAVGECDLIVKGSVAGEARGWVRDAGGQFLSDRASEAPSSDSALRAQAAIAGQELTYTCVPPGEGTRAGIDRDVDGYLDRDELDAGSDPADPLSTPLTIPQIVVVRTSKLIMKDDVDAPVDPNKRRITFNVKSKYALPSRTGRAAAPWERRRPDGAARRAAARRSRSTTPTA